MIYILRSEYDDNGIECVIDSDLPRTIILDHIKAFEETVARFWRDRAAYSVEFDKNHDTVWTAELEEKRYNHLEDWDLANQSCNLSLPGYFKHNGFKVVSHDELFVS